MFYVSQTKVNDMEFDTLMEVPSNNFRIPEILRNTQDPNCYNFDLIKVLHVLVSFENFSNNAFFMIYRLSM